VKIHKQILTQIAMMLHIRRVRVHLLVVRPTISACQGREQTRLAVKMSGPHQILRSPARHGGDPESRLDKHSKHTPTDGQTTIPVLLQR